MEDGLLVVDLTDPVTPVMVRGIVMPNPVGVALASTYAYVVDLESGLLVVDIANPAGATVVAVVPTPGASRGLALAPGYAYVADGQSGLQVVDISVATSPARVGFVDTPDLALNVAVAGNYAYVADGSSGLWVVDISIPPYPALVGNVNTPGTARDVALAGGYAYVADEQYGLQVVDISNPAAPEIIASAEAPSSAIRVLVTGGYAYVSDSSSLVIVDVSDPLLPVIVGSAGNHGSGWLGQGVTMSAAVTGSFVHVTGGMHLTVYPRQCPLSTAVLGPCETSIEVSRLAESHPNPFAAVSGIAAIGFELARPGRATVGVFDAKGRQVRILVDAALAAGAHTAYWDGRNDRGERVSAGVYFYRLDAQGVTEARPLVLLR